MQNKYNGHSCCQTVTITKGLESAFFTYLQNKSDICKASVLVGHILCLANISYSNEILLILFSFLLPNDCHLCDRDLFEIKENVHIVI